jgi:hypothetical protein
MEQYPDTIQYKEGGSTKTLKCRFVPNLRNAKIMGVTDKIEIVYKYDIVFPFGSAKILAGTKISGTDKSGNQIVIDQPLIQWHQGELHNRGWI